VVGVRRRIDVAALVQLTAGDATGEEPTPGESVALAGGAAEGPAPGG
jgi:hypothetical protein